MMKKTKSYELEIPTIADVKKFEMDLRESDVRDLNALDRDLESCKIIEKEILRSELVFVLKRNLEPCVLFGAINIGVNTGQPWLIARSKVEANKIGFARVSKKCLAFLLEYYRCLETFINEENKRSIKWHKWCGFELTGNVLVGKTNFIKGRLVKGKMYGDRSYFRGC